MIREAILREVFPSGIPPYQYANPGVLDLQIIELEKIVDQIRRTEQDNNKDGNKLPYGTARQDATLRNVAQPQSSDKFAIGSYLANFYEAPVKPLAVEEPGRNKYGRYDQDVPPEIDEEIRRLRGEGRDCRGIASELERLHGVQMHYRRVQGRLSVFRREANRETPPKPDTKKAIAEASFFSEKIDERILDLTFDDLTPEEISKELEKDGALISPEHIAVRLVELNTAPDGEDDI